MSTRRRALFAIVALAMLALLAWRIVEAMRRLSTPVEVDLAFTQLAEVPWAGTEHLVDDERAGHRPRREFAQRFENAPLGAPEDRREVVRRTGRQGLVSATALPAVVPGPRVLVLGDDQTMGGVPNDALWPQLLEERLRALGRPFEPSVVLNAAADQYGPVHHLLRGPELVERYAPRVLVVAFSSGDDVVALDDRRFPHLDDAMFAVGPQFPPTDDPLGLNARARALCPEHPELARRGLAQAAWLLAAPARAPLLERKLRQVVDWLRDVAPRGSLLVLVIPPPGLVQPDHVAALCGGRVREVLDTDAQARAHAMVLEALRSRGVAFIDLLPPLRAAAADPDLYRTDGRLGVTGNRIAAQALAPRVERVMRR